MTGQRYLLLSDKLLVLILYGWLMRGFMYSLMKTKLKISFCFS